LIPFYQATNNMARAEDESTPPPQATEKDGAHEEGQKNAFEEERQALLNG
jgi:hypothetical protein